MQSLKFSINIKETMKLNYYVVYHFICKKNGMEVLCSSAFSKNRNYAFKFYVTVTFAFYMGIEDCGT